MASATSTASYPQPCCQGLHSPLPGHQEAISEPLSVKYGDHGLIYKSNFLDSAVRVPLLVKGPGVVRGVCEGPVEWFAWPTGGRPPAAA